MLVLSRKKGETIILGNDIEISILQIEGDQVKLGINAPKNVEVHRKEIYLMIQNENKSAANQSVSMENLQKLINKKNDR